MRHSLVEDRFFSLVRRNYAEEQGERADGTRIGERWRNSESKIRRCLRCRGRFRSESFGNRVCGRCQQHIDAMSAKAQQPGLSLDYRKRVID